MPRVIVLLTCLAALAVGSPTASAAKYKDCAALSETVGAIQAKNMSCKRARKLVRKHTQGVEEPGGFTCVATPYEGGATNVCKKGIKRFRYSIAD